MTDADLIAALLAEPIDAPRAHLTHAAAAALERKDAEILELQMMVGRLVGGDELQHLMRLNNDLLARAQAAESRLARAREALTPSSETKAAYIGEFTFDFRAGVDEFGDDQFFRRVQVPWTTIKEIMAAISARAWMKETSHDRP